MAIGNIFIPWTWIFIMTSNKQEDNTLNGSLLRSHLMYALIYFIVTRAIAAMLSTSEKRGVIIWFEHLRTWELKKISSPTCFQSTGLLSTIDNVALNFQTTHCLNFQTTTNILSDFQPTRIAVAIWFTHQLLTSLSHDFQPHVIFMLHIKWFRERPQINYALYWKLNKSEKC